MDLVFEGGAEIRFSVEPPAEVHILGYYIMQMEDEEGTKLSLVFNEGRLVSASNLFSTLPPR